jgi:hypothetical protein
VQAEQQGGGIGAARGGHEHVLAAPEHGKLADGPQDPEFQGRESGPVFHDPATLVPHQPRNWRNQNKNATDFTDSTDWSKIPNHVLGQVAPVQTYQLLGLLNLWHPWHPWRFCFFANSL